MTREEAIKGLKMLRKDFSGYKPNEEMFDMAIKALEQEPTTKIEESNFSQEQYLTDIQGAYDCGESAIDKIQAEIEKLPTTKCTETRRVYMDADDFKKNVLVILDKYKTESEEYYGKNDI